MNSRQLRYFCKVVELANMTRAAQALNIAQPALGQQIRQLEEDIGKRLLERHSRGVAVTPAGRLLYVRASDILRRIADVEAELREAGTSGREGLRIGLSPWLTEAFASRILAEAQRCKIEVDLFERAPQALAAELGEGLLHAGLAPGQPAAGRRARALGELVFTLFRGGSGTRLGIMPAEDDPLRAVLEDRCAALLTAAPCAEATGPASARALALAYATCAMLPVTGGLQPGLAEPARHRPIAVPVMLMMPAHMPEGLEDLLVRALQAPAPADLVRA